jgi:uncharacterized protein (TIGR02145 family)
MFMKKIAVFAPFLLALSFIACGDDDSGVSAQLSDDSSSSVCEDCGDVRSSSSVIPGSSGDLRTSSSQKQGDGGLESSMTNSSAKSSSSSSEKSSSSSAIQSSGDGTSSSVLSSSSEESSGSEKSSSSSIESSSSEEWFGFEESSSSVALATPCKTETEDNCEYGELIDSRDGQKYKTVKIGEQWWMAENLNYAYLQPTATLDSSSFCYNHETAKCDEYGRLYMWSAAMDSVGMFSEDGKGCGWHSDSALVDTVRGVCPEGWHLPSATEFMILAEAVGGMDSAGLKLKSTSGWKKRSDGTSGNGTDAFGFKALAAGAMVKLSGIGFEGLNMSMNFWTSTQKDRNFFIDRDDYAVLYSNYEDFGYPVRCVKD